MHNRLLLIGTLGRALPTEPRNQSRNSCFTVPTTQRAPSAPAQQAAKALSTVAAQFALAGLELISEVGLDGLPRLYTLWRGKVQPLNDLDHARIVLAQIGGANA